MNKRFADLVGETIGQEDSKGFRKKRKRMQRRKMYEEHTTYIKKLNNPIVNTI